MTEDFYTDYGNMFWLLHTVKVQKCTLYAIPYRLQHMLK
jgi:hypothetical protein